MANNRKYNYDSLAEVNGNGIDIALFPQIREAIAERMKEIFGNDIDLSTASADGQYINMESLIFNNMYQLLSYLFDNINPNTASGKYLDVLMSLVNIKRKGPTYSTVQVYVKYLSASTMTPQSIIAQDRNGVTWTWKNPVDLSSGTGYQYTFNQGDNPICLTFTCDSLGPVQAYRGTAVGSISDASFWTQANFQDINGSVYLELSNNFLLYEDKDAVIGSFNETDQSLKNRKARYIGGNSTTTQEGLETAIYNYAAVEDVYVFNNVTGVTKKMEDNVNVLNHDVYVVVRYKDNIDDTNTGNEIAKIIYNKLTPGVNTCDVTTTAPDLVLGGSVETRGIEFVTGYRTNIYWKKCVPITVEIKINFTALDGYIQGQNGDNSDCELAIIAAIENYLNAKPLNSTISVAELQVAMMSGDLKPNGTNTFIPTSGTIDSGVTPYKLPLTYIAIAGVSFDYTNYPACVLTIN